MTQAQLEVLARVQGQIPEQARRIGYARAELLLSDIEGVCGRSKSEIGASGRLRIKPARQKFEEELAKRQMDHADALAREQLGTAQAAARAARMAAWAAIAAAFGAIAQAVIAIVK